MTLANQPTEIMRDYKREYKNGVHEEKYT